MASGGGDEPENNLDLSEVIAEIRDLDTSTESDYKDSVAYEPESKDSSLAWELTKADLEYEQIATEAEANPFIGFGPQTSTPTKRANSYTYRTKPKKSPKGTRSAPVSPASPSNTKVKGKIKSWEKLIHHKTGAIPKIKTTPIVRASTRAAAEKGLVSPLEPAGDFLRGRKLKRLDKSAQRPARDLLKGETFRTKVKVLKKGKVKRKPRAQQIIITMDQPDILRAGRLNPRNRRAGGIGETVADLHFPDLATVGISPSGKLIIRRLLILRETIVANSNIVLAPAGNVQAAIKSLQKYLERIKEIYTSFQSTAVDIADANVNGLAVMGELITLEDEIEGLNEYCEEQLVNIPPAAGAAAGAGQIRLQRISLPTFNGEGNYNNWKTDFDLLIVHVDESMKRARLIESLEGDAKVYIKSVYTPDKTYLNIVSLLEARYNDPLVVNYNLLDRVFNNPDMANPNSTEKHWDNVVGNINAVIASGMTMAEVLVYFNLHKFQPLTVTRVKMLHKIKYPGRASINLTEAVFLMNQVIAEEVALKKDSVALEQTMQGLTMNAVPKISKVATPAVASVPQAQKTSQPQSTVGSDPQSQSNTQHQKTMEVLNKILQNQKTVAPVSQPQGTSKKQSKNNGGNNWFCTLCQENGHDANKCTKYPTPKDKRDQLTKVGGCWKCAGNMKVCDGYYCNIPSICRTCKKWHFEWLCLKTVQQPK